MNLAEVYALTAGQKLDRPYILEAFYPLSIPKYITFQPFSKPSKNYDYWQDVIELVVPALKERGIEIVQIGAAGEPGLPRCHHLMGATSLRQTAYVIGRALAHVGADSFAAHIASSIYDIPTVAIYSNNYAKNVKPYFGTKHHLIELDWAAEKPVYALEAFPKRINTIFPHVVANKIFEALEIQTQIQNEYKWIGPAYHLPRFELIPNCNINPQQFGAANIIVRYDILKDLGHLVNQCNISKITIVSDVEIPLDVLKQIRPQITECVFKLSPKFHDHQYIKKVINAGVRTLIVSEEPEEIVNGWKLDFCDLGIIHRQDYPELPFAPKYYKSSKYIFSHQKMFASLAAFEQNIPTNQFKVLNEYISLKPEDLTHVALF